MPQNWFEQNAPKKKSWFEENAPKAQPSQAPTKPTSTATTTPKAGPTKTTIETEYQRGDQIDPVPTIGPNGQRGTVSTSGSKAGQDFIPFTGAPFQTSKGEEMGISLGALPDISKLTPNQLKDVMVPRFRPLQAVPYHLTAQGRGSAIPYHFDPQMLPVNRLLTTMGGRDIAGFAGTVTGSEVGGALGGAAGAATGVPGAETVGGFGGQLIGAGLTGPAAMRVYDWLKGTPSPTTVPQDIATSVAQQVGQKAVPWLLEKGVQSELLAYLTNRLPLIGGAVGADIGYHSGIPYGLELGGAIGAAGGAGLKGTIQAVTATPEYRALSATAQRSVLSLLERGETGIALGILARKGTGPVYGALYGALQPQGRTGPAGQPKGPKGTNTALSPQDEQAFRQFIRDRNVVFDPNNPKPDWDARGWWLQNWKQ